MSHEPKSPSLGMLSTATRTTATVSPLTPSPLNGALVPSGSPASSSALSAQAAPSSSFAAALRKLAKQAEEPRGKRRARPGQPAEGGESVVPRGPRGSAQGRPSVRLPVGLHTKHPLWPIFLLLLLCGRDALSDPCLAAKPRCLRCLLPFFAPGAAEGALRRQRWAWGGGFAGVIPLLEPPACS